MATLRETRNRIVAVRNTSKITQAMRMVAAAKLRRAQEAIMAARPYAEKVQGILTNLASVADRDFIHPFFVKRKQVSSVAILVVSSDRGLCGAFNANVLRAVTARIQEYATNSPGIAITVIPVGRRAVSAVRRSQSVVEREYPDVFLKLDFSTAADISNVVSSGFLSGRFDLVEAIYTEFVTIIRQVVKTQTILPVIPEETGKPARNVQYIFEPDMADILYTLLPMYLNLQVWKVLLDSNAAEQASRMMAMENATINARDLITSLQLLYNRERQAAITKEMLEIVGGAEALSAS